MIPQPRREDLAAGWPEIWWLVVEQYAQQEVVVDDNLDSAEMMVALAETWGHEAFHATDGNGAVAMALELRPEVADDGLDLR